MGRPGLHYEKECIEQRDVSLKSTEPKDALVPQGVGSLLPERFLILLI